MVMHVCNGDIKTHFWIVFQLMMQQFEMHIQLLVCDIKGRAGILFGKDAFGQLGNWQHYTNRIVYVKQLKIPLVVRKSISDIGTLSYQHLP